MCGGVKQDGQVCLRVPWWMCMCIEWWGWEGCWMSIGWWVSYSFVNKFRSVAMQPDFIRKVAALAWLCHIGLGFVHAEHLVKRHLNVKLDKCWPEDTLQKLQAHFSARYRQARREELASLQAAASQSLDQGTCSAGATPYDEPWVMPSASSAPPPPESRDVWTQQV